MVNDFAATQWFWPGLFLAFGGIGKLLPMRERGAGTVLDRLVPSWVPVRPLITTVGLLEFCLGALLFLGILLPWSAWGAAGTLSAAALISAWGVSAAPDADCGCLGEFARGRLSQLTVARAGMLALMAAAAAVAGRGGLTAQAGVAFLTVAEGLVLALLSPELRDRLRISSGALSGAICRLYPRSGATLRQLRRSGLWLRAQPHLLSELPAEIWRDGCWRFICFPAIYHRHETPAVFAVRLDRSDMSDAVAFVDEEEGRVLARFEA